MRRTVKHSGRAAAALRRQSGFMLLEMLVAVAILAALVAIIPRSFVSARATIDRSQDWMEARLVAEAVFNDQLAGPALKAGIRRGTLEGRNWTAVLEPSRILSVRAVDTDRIPLDVRLAVAVSGGASLEIETMRVGVAQ